MQLRDLTDILERERVRDPETLSLQLNGDTDEQISDVFVNGANRCIYFTVESTGRNYEDGYEDGHRDGHEDGRIEALDEMQTNVLNTLADNDLLTDDIRKLIEAL